MILGSILLTPCCTITLSYLSQYFTLLLVEVLLVEMLLVEMLLVEMEDVVAMRTGLRAKQSARVSVQFGTHY